MEEIDTTLDDQIQFMEEKVSWCSDHGSSDDVFAIYKAILESLHRLKNLEK